MSKKNLEKSFFIGHSPPQCCASCKRPLQDTKIKCVTCQIEHKLCCAKLDKVKKSWSCDSCRSTLASRTRSVTSLDGKGTNKVQQGTSNLLNNPNPIPISEVNSQTQLNPCQNSTLMEDIVPQQKENQSVEKLPSPERPVSVKSKTTSRHSSKQQLAIERLEEEKNIMMSELKSIKAIEREFLKKKYDILEQGSTSSKSDISVDENEYQDTIKHWVQTGNISMEQAGPSGIESKKQVSRDTQEKEREVEVVMQNFLTNQTLQGAHAANENAKTKQSNINKIHTQKATYNQTKQNLNANSYHPFNATIPWLQARTNEEFLNATNANTTVFEQLNLTPSQLAARQVISKELPIFTGDPRTWPIFISSYANSTQACGFSNIENLSRLTKALKGKALEAVQGYLLLPNNVPHIINTLRMLFGKTDNILNALLADIRALPTIHPERLSTLIQFGNMVQNLCSTMEAADMSDHLRNPILLKELIHRLPATLKLEWARKSESQSIKSFSTWLFGIVEAANEVNNEPYKEEKTSQILRNMKSTTKKPDPFHGVHQYDQPKESMVPSDTTFLNSSEPQTKQYCTMCRRSSHHLRTCNKFSKYDVPKRWKVIKRLRLCYSCLGNHQARYCSNKIICNVEKCDRYHHPLLHMFKINESPSSENTERLQQDINKVNLHHIKNQRAYFQIVPVKIYGKDNSIETFAFLDTGSEVTILEDVIANQLKINGPSQEFHLQWTAGMQRKERNSKVLRISISAKNSETPTFELKGVRTVEKLNLPIQTQTINVEDYPHLQGIELPEYENAQPQLLIGLQDWQLLTMEEIREGENGYPIAVRTKLGWTLFGGCGTKQSGFIGHHTLSNEELHLQIKNYFELENIGIGAQHSLKSNEDMRASKLLEEGVKRIGDRFEARLLWRTENIILPESYNMALLRLKNLEKRMKKDHNLANSLKNQIRHYEEKDYIRRATKDELKSYTGSHWYLPIFSVVNPNKPTKFRLVWDAAASVNGISLNSQLLKGPDFLVNLVEALYKFREHLVAITGDISEMFHQIKINEADQQYQRFLWRDNEENEPTTFIMTVMTFGACCSPSIAHYVKNINAQEWSNVYPKATDAIIKKHYVDDWLDSYDTEEECLIIAKQVIEIHSKAGFEIRNFMSNSKKVVHHLNNINVCKKKCISQEQQSKILGMWWNMDDDMFYFQYNKDRLPTELLLQIRKPTKREVLRAVMLIYDPLGLICFFPVSAKILLQDIWQSKIKWDDPINEKEYQKWLNWINILPYLAEVKIPRCYFSVEYKQIQLHIFVDASELAMAAVGYFRIVCEDKVEIKIIGAKSKVAPVKPISIPRLELQAAVIGSRLGKSIKKGHALQISSVTYWSDSTNVLAWIKSEPRNYKPFVAFRIVEIQENTNFEEWRWVPSSENVADEATKNKDIMPRALKDGRWFNGPNFLSQPKESWPQDKSSTYISDEVEQLEMKRLNVHNKINYNEYLKPDINRFSSWSRLVHTMAYVLRFFYMQKYKLQNEFEKFRGAFREEEIQSAKNYLYRLAQQESFPQEYYDLCNNVPVDKGSKIFNKSPFLDHNKLIRMKSRLENALSLEYDQRYPIILPRSNRITYLLIDNFHRKYLHNNHETVVNEIKQYFIIPRLRATIKQIRKGCQKCRNEAARPNTPEMAPLPLARTSVMRRPFTCSGVDYFGPIEVVVGRRVEKRWGVLFTCLTVRAIHIELAHTLSTDSFIMALRCFIARRGCPAEIYSDNGTNFRGTDNELKSLIKNNLNEEYKQKFSEIKWYFNPPYSPHMGGAWERLIRSVKLALKASLPTRHPRDEQLRCSLAEVEAIVNSRPLSYVSETEQLEALTPNHFLIGSSSGVKPFSVISESEMSLGKRWEMAQVMSQKFWKRFIKEYLPCISSRSKWYETTKPIKIGDVVAVYDVNLPNSWRLGKVIEIFPSKDHQIRAVKVKTMSGEFIRPTNKLAVLESSEKKSEFTEVIHEGDCKNN